MFARRIDPSRSARAGHPAISSDAARSRSARYETHLDAPRVSFVPPMQSPRRFIRGRLNGPQRKPLIKAPRARASERANVRREFSRKPTGFTVGAERSIESYLDLEIGTITRTSVQGGNRKRSPREEGRRRERERKREREREREREKGRRERPCERRGCTSACTCR